MDGNFYFDHWPTLYNYGLTAVKRPAMNRSAPCYDHCLALRLYGSDPSICENAQGIIKTTSEPINEGLDDNAMSSPGRCLLLELPAEIRSMIFEYVLPTTFLHQDAGLRWKKGTTDLLAVSRKIHDEAAHVLYGQSTFVLDVRWDCIIQSYHELNLMRIYPFPEAIGPRYVPLLQYLEVIISFDKITASMKQGVSDPTGLTQGLRGQVEALCGILRNDSTLKQLCVHLQDEMDDERITPEARSEMNETILKPFFENFPGVLVTLSDEEASQYAHCPGFTTATGEAVLFLASKGKWYRTRASNMSDGDL
ncbi:MAG: hypothetical protein Q9173_006291 [Seirophora scorigena]